LKTLPFVTCKQPDTDSDSRFVSYERWTDSDSRWLPRNTA